MDLESAHDELYTSKNPKGRGRNSIVTKSEFTDYVLSKYGSKYTISEIVEYFESKSQNNNE